MKDSQKNNPFKTPEGYFENFADNLLNKLSKESLDLSDPDRNREIGFTVPEAYFDGLYKNIEQKLDLKETKVVPLHPYRKYYFAAAAAAVVLLIIGLTWSSSEVTTFGELAHAEIEAYFEDNEFGFSSYEIAEMLPVDELDISDILENRLNDDNVVDYLNDNTNDFEELNLEDYE